MMRKENIKILKELGFTLLNENRHLKCLDADGNIRIVSNKLLSQCKANKRFLNTCLSNKTLWSKNKLVNNNIDERKQLCILQK